MTHPPRTVIFNAELAPDLPRDGTAAATMHPVTLSPPCRIGTAESPPPGYPGQAIDDKGKRSDSAVIRSRFQTWLAAASVTGGEADLGREECEYRL
jgi:hypothetical protein